MSSSKLKSGSFQGMGLSPAILKGILRRGYKIPTPIQRKVIPLALVGRDIVGMARTGSGKTAAFLIPILERLQTHSAQIGTRALIISPTRELALQTLAFARHLGKQTDLRYAVLVGGDSMDDQYTMLAANPDVLIATPGRLMHQLMESDMSLKMLQVMVFDEADRLFEMGFSEQIHYILSRAPQDRQSMLFSATMPTVLVDFAKVGLKLPAVVRLDAESTLSDMLSLKFFLCRHEFKMAALLLLLRDVAKSTESTIIFVSSKHHVEYVGEVLRLSGYPCSVVYGEMDQDARVTNVEQFRSGTHKLMVVTDVAARGIDIPLLSNVINFDFPAKPKLFIHRAGRCARAGRSGVALSLVSPDEVPYVIDLHRFLRRSLTAAEPRTEEPDGEEGEATAVDTSVSVYGSIPHYLLDDLEESIRTSSAGNTNLEAMKAVVQNAYKMYHKTRGSASAFGASRAKELDMDVVHPDLVRHVSSATAGDLPSMRRTSPSTLSLLQRIRQFKGRTTVFENDVDSRGVTAASQAMGSLRDAMQDKLGVNVHRRVRFMDFSKDEAGDGHDPAGSDAPSDSDDDSASNAESDAADTDDDRMDGRNDASWRDAVATSSKLSRLGSVSAASTTSAVIPAPAATLASARSTGVIDAEKLELQRLGRLPLSASRAEDGRRAGDRSREPSATAVGRKSRKPVVESEFFIQYNQTKTSQEQTMRMHEDGPTSSADRAMRVEDMVLDMNPEDAEALIKRKAVYKWDKRKKNYVKSFANDAASRPKREADGKKNTYEEWKKKSRLSLGAAGSREDENVQRALQLVGSAERRRRGVRFQGNRINYGEGDGPAETSHRHSHPQRRLADDRSGGKRPRDELKTPDQILKMRKEKLRHDNTQRQRERINAKRRVK